MDNFVVVKGKKIHVYTYGEGPVTVVFLSGSGVPFPQLEYISFQKELASAYPVIGIEKFGYGQSDLADGERSVDTVVNEYRETLRAIGIMKPVVLAAHSMGFLEALRWGQRYPSEILGIIGVDAATPECYEEFDLEKAIGGLVMLSENESLRKASSIALVEQLQEKQLILPAEKEKYLSLAYRNLANQNWIDEAKQINHTLGQIKCDNSYLQIPMLFFISNGEGTSLKKEAWLSHAKHYLSNIKCAQYKVFDYPHNVYQYVYKEMVQTTKDFMDEFIG